MSYHIRPATVADLPAVSAIYNHSVATSTCTFALKPETLAEREAWFAGRTAAYPVIVAEAGGEVVAWASLSAWNKRCGYATTVEWSVYVREDWHRRGIASAMLTELIRLAKGAGHHTIIGGVSTTRRPAWSCTAGTGSCRRPTSARWGSSSAAGWT